MVTKGILTVAVAYNLLYYIEAAVCALGLSVPHTNTLYSPLIAALQVV